MVMNRIGLLLLLLTALVSYANEKSASSVIWLSFSDAWGIDKESDSWIIAYNDVKRVHEAPISMFCRKKVKDGYRIACKMRISGVLDSVYSGIFCRNDDAQYDYLLTGDRTLNVISTIHRTFTVDEILKRTRQPMRRSIPVDTLWHDFGFTLSNRTIGMTYDTSAVGSFDLPFTPDGKVTWGFSALYCNVALKDLFMIDGTSDTIPLPVDTATVFTVPFFKRQYGTSDRILGH
ncbi:MAG: hypothetical protein JW913_01785 [Chitinispirillaceae bacterium]|nr:hypothetical protein [Chitinispirillaceae bacterium]